MENPNYKNEKNERKYLHDIMSIDDTIIMSIDDMDKSEGNKAK